MSLYGILSDFGAAAAFFAQMAVDLEWHITPANLHKSTKNMPRNDAQAPEEIFISAGHSCTSPSRPEPPPSGFCPCSQKYRLRPVPGHQRLRLLGPAARRAQVGRG